MRFKELEDELFIRWEESKEGFIRDGIADENEWNKSNLKLLFVLKEANDPGGDGWDLREFVASGGRSQTWGNIARWVYGIRNIEREVEWEEIEEISDEFRRNMLKSICAVNLKKVPGGHTAVNNDLIEEAKIDNIYLQEQFGIYSDVDIIICCGRIVSDLFHDHVNNYDDYAWEKTKRGIEYHQIGEKKYLFTFLHPEVRIGKFKNILFYGLIDAIKEVYND